MSDGNWPRTVIELAENPVIVYAGPRYVFEAQAELKRGEIVANWRALAIVGA